MALSQISGTTGIADTSITSAKLADFSAAVDLNGVELLLDADQDTSITADTDDVIDFKIAGVEHISLSNSSGDTIIKPRVDGKDIIFQQFDGKKLFEINDGNFVSVGGNDAAAGQIRIFEDTDNGSHYSGFTVGNLTESYVLALPNADGSSGQALTTNGSGVLSFTTLSANTPSSADGQALGSASLEWSDLFLADGAVINFGADQDINLTHVADSGLTTNGFFTLGDGKLKLGSTAVTSTAAELNLLDGVSGLVKADLTKLAAVDSTAAELNIVDGGTSATSTTVADADRVVLNDGGTMVQVAVTDLAAYLDDEITSMPNLTTAAALVTVSALNAGSITSGFGNIDTGASTITTTGLISGGSLDIDNVLINGTTIGHTDDTDLITVADGLVTVAGEVQMTTLDIGGTNVTSTATELNYSDGVTSAIQTQIDTKASTGKAIAMAIVFG